MLQELTIQHFKASMAEYDNWKGPIETLKNNPRLISDEISNLCSVHNNQGFACTRADIVAHSMGGLVARKFVSMDGEKPFNKHYKSAENYGLGSVRRISNSHYDF